MPRQREAIFAPKLLTALRAGYRLDDLRHDALTGLTVAIVALPLAMALAIASGTTPDKGLVTAVIAGFLISALGGSRFQVGGPTGAFIPVVYAVIVSHGFDGLVLATLMAGVLLVIAGMLRVGAWMKFMPQPLIIGFTAGIAVIIFSSQLKDLFGLQVEHVPAEFLPMLRALYAHSSSFNPWALGVALGCIGLILALRRWAPKAPSLLLAVVAASLLVGLLQLPVDTIGSRFGGIASSLPMPSLPRIDLARIPELIPAALTIAFLAGIESLLSATVADGMGGGRHRPNTELVAQGVANTASALFTGLPATGAIARTATNIRAGARSPVAGVLHAVFILAFMLALSSLARFVPLPALAGVLVMVAWGMSEHRAFRRTLAAPRGDRAVLLATFLLTVLVGLTFAIQVGMVIAALVFMVRMAGVVEVSSGLRLAGAQPSEAELEAEDISQSSQLPAGVEVYRISGPLFFGASGRIDALLDDGGRHARRELGLREQPGNATPARAFILRMAQVPIIDASGAHALQGLYLRCRTRGMHLLISGLQAQPRRTLSSMKFGDAQTGLHFVRTYDAALALADTLQPMRPFEESHGH